ncbi:MAG: hypothetical protein J6V16_03795 [Bacteroidales bacterium]|jgi:hypothetical protein|nr:hypothetical protein [Bacteroidales bacterium]MBQ5604235.1 hypothetical protein [Bacteroidales bacterium]
MKGLVCILLMSIPLFLQECQRNQSDSNRTPVVATAGHILYLDEIQAAMPLYLSKEDSIRAAEAFIDQWIKQNLLYEAAEKNLQESSDIQKMVEDYRQALMVYEYQEQVLLEKLKTEVSDQDIADYYEANKQRFLSSRNLIKGIFIKVPVHSSNLKSIKNLYRKKDEASLEQLDLLCLQHAEIYENFSSDWMSFDDVMDHIPSEIDQSKLLKSKDFLEVEDEHYCYLLRIDEYLLSGNPEPLEFVSHRIKNIIINSHKTSFLHQLEDEMKTEAEKKGQIRYY